MDLSKVISDLRFQREHIDQAIQALENLASSNSKKRGRPPKLAAPVKAEGISSAAIQKSAARGL
jgi:hypothetical protein